ncbi:MAG: LysM peptidoglycan-binding domain-containing protein, partial [Bacteroidales bacterium]|nr:LysM peptidoglycan-binding domain-containing protein [Bacteroidales bacterium]
EKKEKRENSIQLNTDIILRDDTIIIPAPIKIHTVKMGETLYSISKQYDCTVEDLISWNPQLEGVLKTGDKLQVVKQ